MGKPARVVESRWKTQRGAGRLRDGERAVDQRQLSRTRASGARAGVRTVGTARWAAALIVFMLLWAGPLATAWAAADEGDVGEAGQDGFDAPGDDASLWADPDELFLLDEGLLFGGEGLFSESQEAESAAPHEVF